MNISPNLYIIGAAKSGTTALSNLLSASSDIFVPSVKEPHFHVWEQVIGKIPYVVNNISEYEKLYKDDKASICRYRVDASVLYLPHYKVFCKNVKAYNSNNVKIIIILRDPLERAISAYKHSLRFDPDERDSFDAAVLNDSARRSGNPMLCYQWLSDYYEQVKMIKENFDDVLIIRSSDLRSTPEKTIKNICQFLAIENFEINSLDQQESNSESFSWKNGFVGVLLNKIFPSRYRYVIRENFPRCYHIIKFVTLKMFSSKEKKNIEIGEEVRNIFLEKKRLIEDYLGYRIS